MSDNLTHTVTITVTGNYPHGAKPHASVMLAGSGGIDHMLDAFRAAILAAGFHISTAERLEMADE